MKKYIALFVLATLLLTFTACFGSEEDLGEAVTDGLTDATPQEESATQEPAETEQGGDTAEGDTATQPAQGGTATLYTDHGPMADVGQYPYEYSGELTVEVLAQGLSELTGLDFFVTAYPVKGEGVTVDWSADSTLIAGLDDREQKEEYFFFDAYSLNEFMLKSMQATIKHNLHETNIYYTMNGGAQLQLPDFESNQFPLGLPYIPLTQTEGTWYFDGDTAAAHITMDGKGNYTAFFASDSVESEGTLMPISPDEIDGLYGFELVSASGDSFVTIGFDSPDYFYVGGKGGNVYERFLG